MKSDRWIELLGLTAIVCAMACTTHKPYPEPAVEKAAPIQPEAVPSTPSPTKPEEIDPENKVYTVSLSGRTSVAVPGTNLGAHISGSFHKFQAPLVGVSVLVAEGDRQAEVSWRIESGKVDSQWLAVAGRRYDKALSKYVNEELTGWQVRLDTVDDHSAGGDPAAITISFRRAP